MGCVGSDGVVRKWVRGSLIGAGSFGKVNLALNSENGNLMAVKSVECNERSGSEHRALEHEIAMLQSIDSAHVVQYLGSSRSLENGKQMLNLFLEYMPGGSLADMMKKFGGFLDEGLIRTYTRGILQGLHYLHSNGIVHCDVKGRNILLGCSSVKLADLGAAKILAGGGEKAESLSQMKGTPLWMAPEVVRQEEQGTPSDIWSLGCTVMEMATGKAPWPNLYSVSPLVALYHIGCMDEVPEMPASLSLEGHDFLRKCLCRNPLERWSTSQLLQHPFVTQKLHVSALRSDLHPLSPNCVLDTWNSQASSVLNSVPLLSLKRDQIFHQMESRAAGEESPKQQTILESKSHLWGSSPLSPKEGQWIVVHSPQACPPISEAIDGIRTLSSQHPFNYLTSQDGRLESDTFPMDFSTNLQNSSCSLNVKDAKQGVSANHHNLKSSSSDLWLSQQSIQHETNSTQRHISFLSSQRHIELHTSRGSLSQKFCCRSNLRSVLQRIKLASPQKMKSFSKSESFYCFYKGGCAIYTYAPFMELHYRQFFVKLHLSNKKGLQNLRKFVC